MAAIDYRGVWKARRYDWKERIGRSQSLSRGAKLLATRLCDSYANHKTACCWPSNETLALALGADVRSVQRWLKELRLQGWVSSVRIPGRRRALQLVFPKDGEHDREHDAFGDAPMTEQTSKHDRSVAAHNEPKKNLTHSAGSRGALSFQVINSGEASYIEAWKDWIHQNLEHDVEQVFEFIATYGGFALPSRYPTSNAKDRERYQAFFDAAVRSNGAVFGG